MSDDPREALAEIARLLQHQLAWQRELGVAELPRVGPARAHAPRPSPRVAEAAPAEVAPAPREAAPVELQRVEVAVVETPRVEAATVVRPAPVARPAAVAAAEPATRDGADRVVALKVVQDAVRGCQSCKLSQRRTNTVFARGNPFARVVFVGEGPGEQEDRQGLPFVGPAGQLLDKIIGAMNLTPDDVYICNVVKCRPPGNRTPEPDEVAACTPFLAKQLELVKPEVMVALGRTAAGFLLETNAPMGKLRGQWHEYRGVPLLPTWHPSYLLREPERKRDTWADMQLVMARLGIAPPAKRG